MPDQEPTDRKTRLLLELSVLSVVVRNECPRTPVTLETIAEVCGVSKQAVAAIELKAIKKLRNHPDIKPLINHLKR